MKLLLPDFLDCCVMYNEYLYCELWRTLVKDKIFYQLRPDENKLDRTHTDLVWLVETLGKEVNLDEYSELKIVEIPNDVEWEISSCDRGEWIAEKHRTWE